MPKTFEPGVPCFRDFPAIRQSSQAKSRKHVPPHVRRPVQNLGHLALTDRKVQGIDLGLPWQAFETEDHLNGTTSPPLRVKSACRIVLSTPLEMK